MKFLKNYYPIIFLGLITCILFYKILFFGQIMYGAFDNFDYVTPLKYFLVNEIHHGNFPLWNPYIDIGVPYLADMTIGTFSIFNVFYFLFPVPYAVGVIAAIGIFLLSFFHYLYLRALTISKIGSLFGAMVLALSGTIFQITGAVDTLPVVVYIPLIFLALHLFVMKKQLKYLLLLILFQTLQILAGHPRPTYYTILFVASFLLFWSSFQLKKRLVIIVTYIVGFLSLSAVQLMPLIEGVFHSTRPLSSIAYASSGNLTPAHLLTFLFPTFFGSHMYGTWWGPQIELYGYLSVPGLIFLVYGIVKGKVIHKSFYLVSLFLAFFLALGKISPLYVLFYYIIPGWKQFRDPIDILILFMIFASILIAAGFDYAIKNSRKSFVRAKKVLPVALGSTVLLLGWYVVSARSNFWSNFLNGLYKTYHIHVLGKLLIYDSNKLQVIFSGITQNVLLFFFFWAVTAGIFVLFSRRKSLLAWSFLLFTTAVFIYFDSSIVMVSSANLYKTTNPTRSLTDVASGSYRILSLPIDLHQNRRSLAIPDFFYKESQAKLSTLQANFNSMSGMYQIRGFTTLTPGSFAKFIQENPKNIIDIDFSHVTEEQLNETSVKYIISYDRLSSFSNHFSPILEKPHAYYVYENPSAYKRAYLLHNPLKDLTITSIDTQKIKVDVTSPSSDNLIVTDWYYPGWRATVNGSSVVIKEYHGTFQMVAIPKGKSVVVLTYQSIPFTIGLWITILSLGLGCVLFLVRNKHI